MPTLRDASRHSLVADVVVGLRQLNKHRAVSAAAILSLGLAIGATTAAFRLVDAVLLRPMPVADPAGLFVVATTFLDAEKKLDLEEIVDYPTYRRYSEAAGDRAELMALGGAYRTSLTFEPDGTPEQAYRQHVSGNVFPSFGLRPAIGRLLSPADDLVPGGHPVAVLSDDYWRRRFGRDPDAVGQRFRMGSRTYEIVGVAPSGFTGTEPGVLTDVFLPAMMNADAINNPNWSWLRIWARPRPGVAPEQVRDVLHAAYMQEHRRNVEKMARDTPREAVDALLSREVRLIAAGTGASRTQRTYRRPLTFLAALVVIVLVIACVNVANLRTAQAAARAREMAIRVSLGAGRARLVRMLLVESALVSAAAMTVGWLFAWPAAPFVVSLLAPPEEPVRLAMEVDWRAVLFGALVALGVTSLFGVLPAIRASAVHPAAALRDGRYQPSHARLMRWLVAAQIAFCVFVLFVASLFVATFDRLSARPLGFSSDRLLVVKIENRGPAQPPAVWASVTEHLRQTPGVSSAAFAGWAPLSGNRWSGYAGVPGRPVENVLTYMLDVVPGYFETMGTAIISGRDFRPGDLPPRADPQGRPMGGVGIVNEAFARQYFDGGSPIGRLATRRVTRELDAPMEIVGLVPDAVYYDVRETMRPTVYVPIEDRSGGSLIVRTTGDPAALVPALRNELSRARPDFTVADTQLQRAVVRRQMLRERLLATLSLFFAAVALLLAGVGLYGVLNHAVVRQRHEIGVRLALGARTSHIVGRVTSELLGMTALGVAAGVIAGLSSARIVESLLFQVTATDASTLATPVLTLVSTAIVATIPPAIRAARTDPAETLRGSPVLN